MQNISHAVMSQRHEPKHSLDDFPTPPWATRALFEHVIGDYWQSYTCWEPACGRGDMDRVLLDHFLETHPSDIYQYGHGHVGDFLQTDHLKKAWVISNPPFKLAEQFIQHGLSVATVGVAMLVRSVFAESVGRYSRLFSVRPPSIIAQFVERVPMVKGRLDPKASTATAYAWFVWQGDTASTRFVWIPPCRKRLERDGDYEA